MAMCSKTLLDSINKLRECFANTTAALAPYPTTAVKKDRGWRVFGESPCFVVKNITNGHMVKCTFRSMEEAQELCDKWNNAE